MEEKQTFNNNLLNKDNLITKSISQNNSNQKNIQEIHSSIDQIFTGSENTDDKFFDSKKKNNYKKNSNPQSKKIKLSKNFDTTNHTKGDFYNILIEGSIENDRILPVVNYITNNDIKLLFEKTIVKKDLYSNYKNKKLSLSFMLFYIVLYFFCCCTLLVANCQDPKIIDEKYNVPFHMLDFWGSFGFTLIEASILVIADMVEIGSIRYFIVSINIGTTLVSAVLFSFDPEFWEIPCHWIEFSAQIFITFSDVLFIFHQFKKTDNILYKYRYHELVLVCIFSMAAITKLLVFGEIINLGIDAEQAAHFFEYCGEMVNAIFAFIFTLVMYKECDQNIKSIFVFDYEKNQLI